MAASQSLGVLGRSRLKRQQARKIVPGLLAYVLPKVIGHEVSFLRRVRG